MTTEPDHIEAIARAYCKRLGLDPDSDWGETVEHRIGKSGSVEAKFTPAKMWQRYIKDVREAIGPMAMREAIEEVMGK